MNTTTASEHTDRIQSELDAITTESIEIRQDGAYLSQVSQGYIHTALARMDLARISLVAVPTRYVVWFEDEAGRHETVKATQRAATIAYNRLGREGKSDFGWEAQRTLDGRWTSI